MTFLSFERRHFRSSKQKKAPSYLFIFVHRVEHIFVKINNYPAQILFFSINFGPLLLFQSCLCSNFHRRILNIVSVPVVLEPNSKSNFSDIEYGFFLYLMRKNGATALWQDIKSTPLLFLKYK